MILPNCYVGEFLVMFKARAQILAWDTKNRYRDLSSGWSGFFNQTCSWQSYHGRVLS